MDIFRLTGLDIVKAFNGNGERFTEFVDTLIRAQASFDGIPFTEIRTNIKVTIQDGGVDTEVLKPGKDSLIGWMQNFPTLWQYKSSQNNISPSKDVAGKYSKELISKGYAYRLCVCEEETAFKKGAIEEKLNNQIKKIKPDSPQAKVLSAGDLAAWASLYPSIVLSFFLPSLKDKCITFSVWEENDTTDIKHYVPVILWKTISQEIQKHTDFTQDVPQIIFSLGGQSGVGKTRLVLETLKNIKNHAFLVLYTTDEQKALDIAYLLANLKNARAILVADECNLSSQGQINKILNGSKDRVRVITIDNELQRQRNSAPEHWIEKISEEIVLKILETNYENMLVCQVDL
jgi:hypothetical protein